MDVDTFAPFRISLQEGLAEAEATAAEVGAAPLVVGSLEALPDGLAARTLATVPAGDAAGAEEACRSSDGGVAGAPGRERACLCGAGHRRRVAEASRSAVRAGHLGVLLDRPDAPLGLGLFGAGFCTACQVAFQRELAREYGSQFGALDYRRVAADALASASGAVTFDQVHFGRDFWRFRNDSVPQAMAAFVLPTRDAAREAGRTVTVAARFEASGPAQFAAVRHLDAAVFPLVPAAHQTGIGAARLWRAVLGLRGVAAELPAGAGPAEGARLAAALAAAGIGVAFDDPGHASALAPTLRLRRDHARRRAGRGFTDPVAECVVLYSGEADLWTQGLHRAAVEEAGEALARAHFQWTAAVSPAGLRPGTVLVLAHAAALSHPEAAAVVRFLAAGGAVLTFGPLGRAGGAGRAPEPFLPEGKSSGLRIGDGTLVTLPPLVAPTSPGSPQGPALLEPITRTVEMLRSKGRRAAEVTSGSPVQASLWRSPRRLDVHLAAFADGAVHDATVFLSDEVAGTARRARFRSADGADEKLALHPVRRSVSAVLPPFRGYAVLSLVP